VGTFVHDHFFPVESHDGDGDRYFNKKFAKQDSTAPCRIALGQGDTITSGQSLQSLPATPLAAKTMCHVIACSLPGPCQEAPIWQPMAEDWQRLPSLKVCF